ncbi:MAG: hypothetical protein DYG89_35830 [Caldilinea sp. CFX5]|nr:hypothetical protein [Caldilinea sp. CFX5]
MKATPLLLLLLLFILLFSLPAMQTVGAPLPTPLMQPITQSPTAIGTIQRIRQRGNLLVAGVLVDQPPFGYRNEQGEVTGFDVDLTRALAKEWGVTVQFVPVTPATRLQSLVAGQVDLVAAALPHTYAGEALIDFSAHYFVDAPALLARSDASLPTLAALTGKTIAAVQGDEALPALFAATAEPTVTPFQRYAPALAALQAAQVDALLGYHTYLRAISAATPGMSGVFTLPENQPFALGVMQGDAYFRNLVDATLHRLQQSGKLTALYQQWFPDRQPPALPLVAGEWPYTFANTPNSRPLTTTRLTQIQQRGKLLVGVAYDLAPFGFVGERGSIQGFDIDLSREFARRWLGDATALELVRVTPETAIPLLRAGQVDLIMAALPLTWHNRAMIDFSQSYFADGQSVLTRADSSVQRLADLDQKVVAVSSGLESVNALTTLIMEAATGVSVGPTVLPFQEIRSAQQALLLGQVDAVIGSSVALAQIQQANPALKIAVADFARQAYAIGIPPFDAQLRDQVNFTLQALAADGAYTTFYQQWFSATPDPLALWFADSALVDPVTQALQLALRPVAWSISVTPAASTTATLRPTATPAPLTSALILSPAPTSTNPSQPLILQPTATPLATLAAAAVTPLALRPSLLATSTTSAATSGVPPSTTDKPALPTTVTIRTSLNANARREPTTTSPILAVLAGGTQWPVITITPDGQWIEVQLSDRMQAWVAAALLITDDGLAAVPATPTRVPPAPTAPPTTTSSLTHRVEATDTLAGIAKAYYGEQRHWRIIYEANRSAIGDDPNALPIGVELLIPPLPE